MKTYPIMLDIHGRVAVVVGGGNVGLRKVQSLLRAGAKVRLITEQAPSQVDLSQCEVIQHSYEKKYLQGAFLVFVCTDNAKLNRKIAADARTLGVLVNVADQPEDCDFYVPAMYQNEDMTIAIGTGGKCPALAASLRKQLEQALPKELGKFNDVLGEIRQEIKDTVKDSSKRNEIMKKLADEESLTAFKKGGRTAIEKILRKILNSDTDS